MDRGIFILAMVLMSHSVFVWSYNLKNFRAFVAEHKTKDENLKMAKCGETSWCETTDTCCPLPEGPSGCCLYNQAECCPGTRHCCPAEHYCCADHGCCQTGQICCGKYCCDEGTSTCCGDLVKFCCPTTDGVCCEDGIQCCPPDHPYCCDKGCCSKDAPVCCNSGCCPTNHVCCSSGCCPTDNTGKADRDNAVPVTEKAEGWQRQTRQE